MALNVDASCFRTYPDSFSSSPAWERAVAEQGKSINVAHVPKPIRHNAFWKHDQEPDSDSGDEFSHFLLVNAPHGALVFRHCDGGVIATE